MMGPAILDFTVNGREWDAMGYAKFWANPMHRTAVILVAVKTTGSLLPARVMKNGKAWSA